MDVSNGRQARPVRWWTLGGLLECDDGLMRIIFLDIDGGLNCKRTSNPRKLPYIVDPPLLERFRHVLAQTGAEVVPYSTTRTKSSTH
jgi:hypothetical protein